MILALRLQRRQGFRHEEERQSQVYERILEFFHLGILGLHKLQQLCTDKASGHRSCCSNSWDDLASNHLDLVEILLWDLVVPCPQVGRCCNETYVEVGVVILLEDCRRALLGVLELRAQVGHLLAEVTYGFVIVDAALTCGIFVVDLDLDILGPEVRELHGGRHLGDGLLVAALGRAQGRRVEVGGREHEVHVQGVPGVEPDGRGRPLRPAPEEGAVALAVVQGEGVEELRDGVVELVLELHDPEAHAQVEGPRPLLQHPLHAVQPCELRGASALCWHLGQVCRGLRQERVHLPRALHEELLEEVARPLDGVLDGVGEVLEGAKGNGLLGGILRVAVGLRLEGQDHLHVGLRAQGPGLQQRLPKPHAPRVDVHARLDVVEGIDDAVQGVPKDVVEGVLRVAAHPHLHGLHLQGGVHRRRCLGCDPRLGMSDVGRPEQELAVQVGNLDPVHVGDRKSALLPTANTHHGKALQELAAQGSSAHDEELRIAERLLERLAENGNLVVVPTAHWSPITWIFSWKQFKHVDVKALVQGRVLAGEFHDLLCNHAAEEGGHGADHAPAEERHLLHDIFIHLFDKECFLSPLCLPRRVKVLGQLHASGRRGGVTGAWKAAVLLPVLPHCLDSQVQLLGAPKFGHVGHCELLATLRLRLHQGACEGRELHLLRHLDLGHDALPQVVGVAAGVLDGEGVGARDLDLPGLAAVQLRHALDLPEGDPVVVLEAVPPFVVRVHGAGALLRHARDDGAPGLLAIHVSAAEAISEVNKDSTGQAEGVCNNEADRGRSRAAKLVVPQELRLAGLRKDRDAAAREGLLGQGPGVHADLDVDVELRQPCSTGFRS
mmetsp:Transcript_10588/g.33492  ORF Transcript_10588/g.33492 Transcript_10588/m.33492 type:complete len:836 (-) Transcript_10588:341-2848(-)